MTQRMWTLGEVAPLIPMTVKGAQHALKCGRFPIRHQRVGRRYRFTHNDVVAFVERGEVTNQLLSTYRRPHFGTARRAS